MAYLRDFGRKQPALFTETQRWPLGGVAQAVLLVEGVKPEHMVTLKDWLPKSRRALAFTVRDPPSSKAVRDLVDLEVRPSGILPNACDIEEFTDLHDATCWPRDSFVGNYDLMKVSTFLMQSYLSRHANVSRTPTFYPLSRRSSRPSSPKPKTVSWK